MLAKRFAKSLTADITDICVAQSLLPFLWRDGHLGGRRVFGFDDTPAHPRAAGNARTARGAASRARDACRFPRARAGGRMGNGGTCCGRNNRDPAYGNRALFGDRAIKLDWARPRPAEASHCITLRAALHFRVRRSRARAATNCAKRRECWISKSCRSAAEIENADFWRAIADGTPRSLNWLAGIAARRAARSCRTFAATPARCTGRRRARDRHAGMRARSATRLDARAGRRRHRAGGRAQKNSRLKRLSISSSKSVPQPRRACRTEQDRACHTR